MASGKIDPEFQLMMANALFAFNVEQVWLTVVTATLCAIGAYGAVQLIERFVIPWQPSGRDG